MKTLICLVCLLFATHSFAAEQMGLGFMLGNPTGLNGKYWLEGNRAIDGGVAWSLGKHSDLSLHSDYLLHNDSAFYLNDVHPLDLYYGLGGRMEFADEIELGVRVPVGLAHKLNGGKTDVFGEIAPIIDLFGRTGLEMHFALGGRYYF